MNNGAKSVILLTDHRIVFPVYHFYLDLQWYTSVLIYRRSFFHVDNELHDAFTIASNKSCWNFVFLSHFCIHSKSERKWNAPKRIKRRNSLKQKQFACGVKKKWITTIHRYVVVEMQVLWKLFWLLRLLLLLLLLFVVQTIPSMIRLFSVRFIRFYFFCTCSGISFTRWTSTRATTEKKQPQKHSDLSQTTNRCR